MRKYLIPNDVMVGPAADMQRHLKQTVDNFSTYDFEVLRLRCGGCYSAIPLDDIRRQAINLRKKGLLGSVNGHGPSKITRDVPENLAAYYESSDWKILADRVREYFGHRCCLCNKEQGRQKLDVHHRTYERIGNEQFTDLVAVCRTCHKFADRRRKSEAEMKRQTPSLF